MAATPPSATLTPDDTRALEQTRQRLFQLTNTLGSLLVSFQNQKPTEPLPSSDSLHASGSVIARNLASLSSHLTNHHALLSSITTYPLPNFPAQSREDTLTQLLRKKLEPDVEDWVDDGRARGKLVGAPAAAAISDARGLSADELDQLWRWAGPAANEEARRRNWTDAEYTREERQGGLENVVTGLKRGLVDWGNVKEEEVDEDEEDGEEEEEEDEVEADEDGEKEDAKGKEQAGHDDMMEVDGPKIKAEKIEDAVEPGPRRLQLEELLRFMSTGQVPI